MEPGNTIIKTGSGPVHGRLVETDMEVYEGFKEWLATARWQKLDS